MRVLAAIFLSVLMLPAAAEDVARAVPAQFQGDWCTEPLSDEEDTGESDIRIGPRQVVYYRDSGEILAVAATGDQLALIVLIMANGRPLLGTHEFELSTDGKRITSLRADGQLHTRVRCQA